MSSRKSQKQHIVPRSILKSWCNNDSGYFYFNKEKFMVDICTKMSSDSDVLWEPDYYEFSVDAQGQLEKYFSDLENSLASIIKKFFIQYYNKSKDNSKFFIDLNQKELLKIYFIRYVFSLRNKNSLSALQSTTFSRENLINFFLNLDKQNLSEKQMNEKFLEYIHYFKFHNFNLSESEFKEKWGKNLIDIFEYIYFNLNKFPNYLENNLDIENSYEILSLFNDFVNEYYISILEIDLSINDEFLLSDNFEVQFINFGQKNLIIDSLFYYFFPFTTKFGFLFIKKNLDEKHINSNNLLKLFNIIKSTLNKTKKTVITELQSHVYVAKIKDSDIVKFINLTIFTTSKKYVVCDFKFDPYQFMVTIRDEYKNWYG